MTDETLCVPTLHLNGTSAVALIDQLLNAKDALEVAVGRLSEAFPNPRDYYPQGPEAFNRAREQWKARLAKIEEVQAEIAAILEAVAGAA